MPEENPSFIIKAVEMINTIVAGAASKIRICKVVANTEDWLLCLPVVIKEIQ